MRKMLIGFGSLLLFTLLLISCQKGNEASKKEVTFEELQNKFKQASVKANQLLKSKIPTPGNTGLDYQNENPNPVMTEEEAEVLVTPLIEPSADFLSSYYDINVLEYFPAGDPEIARLGALAIRFKQLEDQGLAVDTLQFDEAIEGLNALNLGIATESVGPDPSIVDCAIDALGIPAGLIVGSAKDMSRKALIKAAKKLASRTLGWIGLGIAIYEFGDCMDWW